MSDDLAPEGFLGQLPVGRHVPLVDGQDDAPPRVLDVAGDRRVHLAQAVLGREHHDRDVRAFDGLLRLDHAHVVDRFLQQPLAPDPCRIDEAVPLAAPHEQAVDGVAGRAGDRRNDRPFLPEQLVQERALAHVGPAHEGEAQGLWLFGHLHARQTLEGLVEQVSHPQAVLGRDGDHAVEPEGSEVGEGAFPTHLELVHRQHDRLAAAAQLLRDGRVVGQQARAPVDHEQDAVALADGLSCLLDGRAEQRVVGRKEQATRVHELEGRAQPAHLGVVAVAGRARAHVGDRFAPPADPVEKRGFAHVWAAREGDFRYEGGRHGGA